MSGFLETILLRLSRLFGRKAELTLRVLADPIAECDAVKPVVIEAVRPVLASEPVADAVVLAVAVVDVVVPVRQSPQFKFAMRLRYVAKVHRWKNGKKPKPVGKARANLKPKPIVAGKVVKKRGPSLFPVKMKPVTAKKPTLRIYIEKTPKKTAEILPFPIRKPLQSAPRLRRAA
ncbi:MAG: hypothetical protein ABL901_15055 [Hyphomicrobiaceae bacterium]